MTLVEIPIPPTGIDPEVERVLRVTPGVEIVAPPERAHAAVVATPDVAAHVCAALGVALPRGVLPAGVLSREQQAAVEAFDGRRPDGSPVRGWSSARPKQQRGAALLALGLRQVLEWATGNGKTRAFMLAASCLGLDRGGRVLVVTASSGLQAYPDDAALVGDWNIAVVIGEGDTPSAHASARAFDRSLDPYRAAGARCHATCDLASALTDADVNMVVVGWDVLRCRGAELLRWGTWDLVVFDELHKARGAKARRADHAAGLAAKARRVWGGTATLVCDRVRDLRKQLWLMAPRAWGGKCVVDDRWHSAFDVRYAHAREDQWGRWQNDGPCAPQVKCAWCADAQAELEARKRHFADFQDRSAIASELPAFSREFLRLPSSAAADVFDAGSSLDSGVEAALEVAFAAVVPALLDELVSLLVSGTPKIICVVGDRRRWVPRVMRALQPALRKIAWGTRRLHLGGFTGEVDKAVRLRACNAYMDTPGPALLVVSRGAILDGRNLQDTDFLEVAAPPWTPERAIQLEGRVRRGGQRRPVRVRYWIPLGTVAERIFERVLSKLESVSAVGSDTMGGAWPEARVGPEQTEADFAAWTAEERARWQHEAGR